MNRLLTILLLAAGTAFGQIDNPPSSVNIVDATATGRAVLTATNAAAAATAIGLGTSNSVFFSAVEVGEGDSLYLYGSGIDSLGFGGELNFEEQRFTQDDLTVFSWDASSFAVTPAATCSTNVTINGNATLNGVANIAPSQTASSGAHLMTRDLIYQSERDFNSGDPVSVSATLAVGGGASQGQFLTFGWSVETTTNTNTAVGVYFGDAIWSHATYSGVLMPANKAIDLTMKGVLLRVESNTNFVNRIVFGVGTPSRTPPAAGKPAATNQSWGVNFFYNGTNHVYQPFWYTTNYNTAPTAVITNLTTANWLSRVYTMRFQQTTNGKISFYINNGLAGRLSSTPTWTTNVTWPSANYGGRLIGMECATATNAAPATGVRMYYRNAYIRYDP